jgi:hypothetical protein
MSDFIYFNISILVNIYMKFNNIKSKLFFKINNKNSINIIFLSIYKTYLFLIKVYKIKFISKIIKNPIINNKLYIKKYYNIIIIHFFFKLIKLIKLLT